MLNVYTLHRSRSTLEVHSALTSKKVVNRFFLPRNITHSLTGTVYTVPVTACEASLRITFPLDDFLRNYELSLILVRNLCHPTTRIVFTKCVYTVPITE